MHALHTIGIDYKSLKTDFNTNAKGLLMCVLLEARPGPSTRQQKSLSNEHNIFMSINDIQSDFINGSSLNLKEATLTKKERGSNGYNTQ